MVTNEHEGAPVVVLHPVLDQAPDAGIHLLTNHGRKQRTSYSTPSIGTGTRTQQQRRSPSVNEHRQPPTKCQQSRHRERSIYLRENHSPNIQRVETPVLLPKVSPLFGSLFSLALVLFQKRAASKVIFQGQPHTLSSFLRLCCADMLCSLFFADFIPFSRWVVFGLVC